MAESPNDARVAQIVAARRARWIKTNTVESPFGMSTPPVPSPQHIATWTEEAKAQAAKEQAT